MLTDRAPRKPALLGNFLESDRNTILSLPQDSRLGGVATAIKSSLESGARPAVRKALVPSF